ncbi:Uncharacterised protein [Vibrio cholerae]|nr:Uncharacterised protein [Vibrio cholerae]
MAQYQELGLMAQMPTVRSNGISRSSHRLFD